MKSLFHFSIIPAFLLLLVSCISASNKPERPLNTNIEITRPTSPAKMLAATEVNIRSGRVPLLTIKGGETRFGILEPGTYNLTAISPDPYRMSDYSSEAWESSLFVLVIEKDKFYRLEVAPADGAGWVIKQIAEE